MRTPENIFSKIYFLPPSFWVHGFSVSICTVSLSTVGDRITTVIFQASLSPRSYRSLRFRLFVVKVMFLLITIVLRQKKQTHIQIHSGHLPTSSLIENFEKTFQKFKVVTIFYVVHVVEMFI